MYRNNYSISFDPAPGQMDDIYSWSTFPSGNFSTIDQSFKKKNICIAIQENNVVGFFAYKLTSKCIEIVRAETKPDFRNKGIAKLLLSSLASYLRPKGYFAYHLYCAPEESQYAWGKLGFEYYPKSRYGKNSDKIEMFKIFGDCCTVVENDKDLTDETNVIKIWNHNAKDENELPKWIAKFEIEENTKNLLRPFIFFGEEDWKIKVMTNGDSKFCRYKDYNRKSEVSQCFYIDKLK